MAQDLNLFQFQNVNKSYGKKNLFSGASVAINENEHVGVIGPNGAGKTTFFRLVNGLEEADSGLIIKSKNLRIGYLSQQDHWSETETGEEFLARSSTLPLWEVKSKGSGLQVTEALLSKPIKELNGGARMRIKLLALLGKDPQLLMLDEPTNYLDLESVLLLESFLQDFDGAFLLISHDREFLKRTTDHTLEVSQGELVKFNGHIDDYFEQKALLQSQLEARAQNLADKKAAILDFVNRFGAKATKARQAQSKLKLLDKMEVIEVKPLEVASTIKIPAPPPTGKTICTISEAQFGYPGRSILEKVNLTINRGDHLAIVGMNGVGKSTLLKGIAGKLTPLQGVLKTGENVKIGYFHQHVTEDLDPEDTVQSSLERAAHVETKPQEILQIAGSLLFSGDDVLKKIKVLSGGEKSRVALGRILLQRTSFLVLDEPTNHLDFQTVEALTQALVKFEGTLVVVSHDRGFIRRVAKKIIEIQNGEVGVYPGPYDDYVYSLQRRLLNQSENTVVEKKVRRVQVVETHSERESKKESEKKKRMLERKLANCELKLAEIKEKQMALNNKMAESKSASQNEIEELIELTRKIEESESEWLSLSTEIEELENNSNTN